MLEDTEQRINQSSGTPRVTNPGLPANLGVRGLNSIKINETETMDTGKSGWKNTWLYMHK